MGIASILLGVLSFLLMLAGFLPVMGVVSVGAPLAALVGIVLGGLAYSRAKQEDGETGTPIAGIIINVIALIPAIVVALTCGLCNACMTAGMVGQPPSGSRFWNDGSVGFQHSIGTFDLDGGARSPFDPPLPPGAPGTPPPAFPPPPLDPDPAGEEGVDDSADSTSSPVPAEPEDPPSAVDPQEQDPAPETP